MFRLIDDTGLETGNFNKKICIISLIFLGMVTIVFTSCKKEEYEIDCNFSLSYPEPQLDSIIVSFGCGEIVCEQFRGGPGGILENRFNDDFHGAYDVVWYSLGNFYGVKFKMEYNNYKAVYDYKEELLMLGVELQRTEIPKKVTNAVKNKYGKSWGIKNARKIFTAYSTVYESAIENEGNKLKTFFLENGSFLDECKN